MSSEKSPEHHKFGARLSQVGDGFLSQVDASRELLALAEQAQDRRLDLEASKEGLTADQRGQLSAALKKFAEQLQKSAQLASDREAPSESVTISFAEYDAPIGRVMSRVIIKAAHQARMPARAAVLRRSMLSLMISDFELLVSEVIGSVLIENSELAGLSEATITLSELEQFGDIERARQAVIDRKVDDMMRRSLDDWVKWFAKLGVNWREMCREWGLFAEIFARRNILVHAGGRVTEQYLAALEDASYTGETPSLGVQLELTDAYLEHASEQLLAFGLLLTGGTWLQLRKQDNEPTSWIVSRTTELLNLNHFEAVDIVTATVLAKSRGHLRSADELTLRTGGWVARRELGARDEVVKEVENWETSSLDLRYSHVKAVLLEDDDSAVAQIRELQNRGVLVAVDLLAAPLYAELVDRRRADLVGADSDLAAEASLRLLEDMASANAGEFSTVGSESENPEC